MAQMQATHTIEGLLTVEVAPGAFVAENGHVMTRLSATKWGGGEGLEILDYSGPGTSRSPTRSSLRLNGPAKRKPNCVARPERRELGRLSAQAQARS